MAVRIVGSQIQVPKHRQTAEQLAPLIGKSADWIVQNTGVRNRHIANGDFDQAKMAAIAARPIVEEYGIPDLIINASGTVRQSIPDTSAFIHRELDCGNIPCFSINATCLSFLVALQTAHDLIEAGRHRRILICSSEIASRGRNMNDAESAALLGDGAAAVMLEKDEAGDSGLKHFNLKTWSSGAEIAQVTGGGMKRFPNDPDTRPEDYLFQMNGPRLLKMVIPKLRRFMNEFHEQSGVSAADVKLVIPHQPSGPGLLSLERLGYDPESIVNIIGEYGNCIAASIPMALCVAMQQNRIQPGDHILFVGTAAGVSIGAGLWRW